MSLEEAAQAIFYTVNSNMADCIAEISTRKGYDVRDFSLLAVGGGGPLCGVFIADILGMPRTVVPRFAASFCAWSMFFLDIGRDYLRSYLQKAVEADPREINRLYEDMIKEAMGDFKAFNVAKEDLVIEKSADARYQGQYHMLEIKLPDTKITPHYLDKMVAEFHQLHKDLFTFSLPEIPVEVTNLHLTAKIKPAFIPIKKIDTGTKSPVKALIGKRQCYFDHRFKETPVYSGQKLKAGNIITGNAVIEEKTTTTVVPAGYICSVDQYGNYNIVRQPGPAGK